MHSYELDDAIIRNVQSVAQILASRNGSEHVIICARRKKDAILI
jgi:hypothetical protein